MLGLRPMGARAVLSFALLPALLVACGGDPPIEREWTPEDHGQPQTVDPARRPTEATPDAPESPAQTRARAARALWNVSCAGCHGRDGRGGGPDKPPGAEMPDFAQAAWQQQRSDEELAQAIAQGKNLMPPFADKINPEGIRALVEHIRTLSAP